MAEVTTKAYLDNRMVINQCDVFRDVEYVEYAIEKDFQIEISKIHFPYAMVLTQACDLQQDYDAKKRIDEEGKGNQDKYLISAIVAPIYNFEDFLKGEHLLQLEMQMTVFPGKKKTPTKNVIDNENKRYHYLKFDDWVPLVESVIDFKHYFTVPVSYLMSIYKTNYVCSIDSLYREEISQRFSHFLARIGLPSE